MNPNELFTAALQLKDGWRVVRSEFEGEPRTLRLRLDFEPGSQFGCPKCGKKSPVYDTAEKTWRHLNFFQYECYLTARAPRIKCEEDGVLQVEVPWARPGSGFTLLFEALAMLLAQQMPMAQVAAHMGEHDTRLWRLLRHYVEKAHAAADWSGVTRIAVDETSARRGHRYVTNVLDAQTRALLLQTPGRGADALKAFKEQMQAHNAEPGQILEAAMDMSPAYAAGVRQHFPQARIVFDKFHVMQLAGKAVDGVRLALGARLRGQGALWALRGNAWKLTPRRRQTRQELAARHKTIGRALSLREALQDIYAATEPHEAAELMRWWRNWAARSRLPAFAQLARTLKTHWDGILAYFHTRLTSGAIEAINGIIQLAKRRARGYRSFPFLRAMSYLIAGKLNLQLPTLSPT